MLTQVYVEGVMNKRDAENKEAYGQVIQQSGPQFDEKWANYRPFMRLGKFDPTVPGADKTYFNQLEEWEQRCGRTSGAPGVE